MPDIPSYNDWIRDTALGVMSPRSGELKAVDNALRDYWNTPVGGGRQPKRNALSAALANWIGTKGPEWRKNERNRPPVRMVERLYDALNTTMYTRADLDAFEFQDEARRKKIETLFRGKEIVWKVTNPAKEVKQTHKDLMAGMGPNGKKWAMDPDSAKNLAAIRKQQQTQSNNRVTYDNGRGNFVRGIADAGFDSGFGIASIETGQLNWAGEQRFGLGGVASTPGDFHTMLHDMAGGTASSSDINWHLMQTLGMSAHQLAADVTPIVSNVCSGVKVLIAWGKVCLAAYRQYKIDTHSSFVMPGGDVAEGFKGMQKLLDRKVWAETREAGLQTADFATRTVLTFTDGGAVSSTAVGVAFTLAKFLHRLGMLLREYAETRDARKLLAKPGNLDSSLFSAYPLLGCYMLLCSDTDEIINMVRTEQMRKGAIKFGDPAWRQQVEWVKRDHLDPVLERAAELVYFSPFRVRDSVTRLGMPVHALHNVGGLTRAAQKLSKASFGVDFLRLGNRLA